MDTRSQAGEAANRTMSRIENDVEVVKRMMSRIENTTDRIIRNARALGYFEPSSDKPSSVAPPTPVITTMADALQALDRAIDNCSGSLNVYD